MPNFQLNLNPISSIASELGVVAPVALRVNVDVEPGTHAKISTGQRSTKFGISTDQGEAADLYHRLHDDPNIAPAGLAVHIGSQIQNLHLLKRPIVHCLILGNRCAVRACRYQRLIWAAESVIIMVAQPRISLIMGLLFSKFSKIRDSILVLNRAARLLPINGVLLTEVIFVKRGDNKRFIIVDAAMNDLLRPTSYEAHHNIEPISNLGPAIGLADIVGPVCETGDYLGRERQMPNLQAGDRLAVMSAGAYGAVMASSYNTRPPAGEVMVLDGKVNVLRQQRSVKSLLDEESIPNF